MALPLRVDQPLLLGLLVIVAAGLILVARYRTRSSPAGGVERPTSSRPRTPRLRKLGWLRPATILLLVLAAGGLEVAARGPGSAILFVVDVSASVEEPDRRLALDYIHRAVEDLGPGVQIGLTVFGEEALIEQPVTHAELPARVRSRPDPEGTNLEAALRLALGQITQDNVARIVLLSDGAQTTGDAVRQARVARARGLRIDTVPLGRETRTEAGEVLLVRVDGPGHVTLDEPFEIEIEIIGARKTTGKVALYLDGVLQSEQTVRIEARQPERLVFSQRLKTAGFHTFSAIVEAEGDQFLQNNEGGLVIHASGRPTVLYLARDHRDQDLRTALGRSGFRVEAPPPPRMAAELTDLDAYGAVILSDVAADLLGSASMAAIKHYVTDLGGGLIMLGASHSFGPGGYADTPIEEVLPVEMRVRKRQDRPSLAVVLVLDKSGSMAGHQSGISKLEAAEDAALGFIRSLAADDLFGLITFDESAVEVVELRPVRQAPSPGQIFARVRAGGGTRIAPAMAVAYASLASSTAERRHVILLSDGQADPGEVAEIEQRASTPGVELTAIGIGQDADLGFLTALAKTGGGRAYLAESLDELAEIFAREARAISDRWLVERRFQPRIGWTHSVLSGIDTSGMPAMTGYVASTAKRGSQLVLMSDLNEPVLACWRHGLGRTLALTSDPSSAWMAEMSRWPGFQQLWVQSVRWVSRRPRSEILEARITVAGSDVEILADAHGPDGRVLDSLEVTAHLRYPGDRQERVRLEQTAPGHYEASTEAVEPGSHRVLISAADRDGTDLATLHRGFFVAPGREHRFLDPNNRLLAELAQITGGSLLDPQSRFDGKSLDRIYRPLWPWLVATALTLLLVEIFLRRRLGLAGR